MSEQKSKLQEVVEKCEREELFKGAAYTANPKLPQETRKSTITEGLAAFLILCMFIGGICCGTIVGIYWQGIKNGDACKELRTAERDRYEADLNYYKESLAGEKKNTNKILGCVEKTSYWNFRECVFNK
jgi:hypothetical protein